MPNFFLDCWHRDINYFRSERGNVDVHRLLASWIADQAWLESVQKIPVTQRSEQLASLGRDIYTHDLGNFASKLRWNVQYLDYLWTYEERDSMLCKHTEMLFASLSDMVMFLDAEELARQTDEVEFVGKEHLTAAIEAGRGVILLGVYQSHPGFLIKHPYLARLKKGVIRYESGGTDQKPSMLLQGLTNHVEMLPASSRAIRSMLQLLMDGQCILLYNDFVYPESKPIISTFFGRKVLISRALISLVLKTRAVVLPFSVARQWPLDTQRVSIELYSALPLHNLQREDPKDLSAGALIFGLATECLVRRYPVQWKLWSSLMYRWHQAESLQ